jgi:hypothetical protein
VSAVVSFDELVAGRLSARFWVDVVAVGVAVRVAVAVDVRVAVALVAVDVGVHVAVAVAVALVAVTVAVDVAVAVRVAVAVDVRVAVAVPPPLQVPLFVHQLSLVGSNGEFGGQSRLAGIGAIDVYLLLLKTTEAPLA